MSKKTFEFSQKLMLKDGVLIHETINEYIFFETLFHWIINSKFRKAVFLHKWLDAQVKALRGTEFQEYCQGRFMGKSTDVTMVNIVRYVKGGYDYTRDINSEWNMLEYWQEAMETYKLLKGDCEDGSVLIYVIARLCDVPASQLFIGCGTVIGGGHAYCIYRADCDGVERTIDWCYYYDGKHIKTREFYAENKNYINEWFRFNEYGIFKRRLT